MLGRAGWAAVAVAVGVAVGAVVKGSWRWRAARKVEGEARDGTFIERLTLCRGPWEGW